MKKISRHTIMICILLWVPFVAFSKSLIENVAQESPLIVIIDKSIDDKKDVKPFLKQLKKQGFKKKKSSNDNIVLYSNKSGGYFKFTLKSGIIQYVDFNQNITLFDVVETSELYNLEKKPENTLFKSNARNLINAWTFPNNTTIIANYTNTYASILDIEKRDFSHYTFGSTKTLDNFYVLRNTKEMVLNQSNWSSYMLNNRIIENQNKPLPYTPKFLSTIGNFKSQQLECLEGDCSSGSAKKIRYYLSKDSKSSYYEGPMVNNYAQGRAKVLIKAPDDSEFLLSGQFVNGVSTGKLRGVNKAKQDSIIMILNKHGQPLEIVRYAKRNNKQYIFKWTPKNNHLYDLSKADISKFPGEIEITALNPRKKEGYDYKLKTAGYMAGGFCLHNFDAVDGSVIFSEVISANGKDYFGKYYWDGDKLRYQNGDYKPSDGASYIRTNCN